MAPFRPLLIESSKVFQVAIVHLVYNSALPLVRSCCSFLLHVVANLICTVISVGKLKTQNSNTVIFIENFVKSRHLVQTLSLDNIRGRADRRMYMTALVLQNCTF